MWLLPGNDASGPSFHKFLVRKSAWRGRTGQRVVGGNEMIKVFLMIELRRSADPEPVLANLKNLDLSPCKFSNVVRLTDDKLVAQLDCESNADATRTILERISPTEGIVQTNVFAVVRPVQH
jgi:hypothetical protein